MPTGTLSDTTLEAVPSTPTTSTSMKRLENCRSRGHSTERYRNYGARDLITAHLVIVCANMHYHSCLLCRLLLRQMNHFCCLYESQMVWITTRRTHSRKSESFSEILTITHQCSRTYLVLWNSLRLYFLVATYT